MSTRGKACPACGNPLTKPKLKSAPSPATAQASKDANIFGIIATFVSLPFFALLLMCEGILTGSSAPDGAITQSQLAETDTTQIEVENRQAATLREGALGSAVSAPLNPKSESGIVEPDPRVYSRDTRKIKQAVLADTINPDSAQFCPLFSVIKNKRGNLVYVGWYTSTDIFGVRGQDNILAEISKSGTVLHLSIGEI